MEEKEESIEIIEDIGEGEIEEGKKKREFKFRIPGFLFYIPIAVALAVVGYYAYKSFFGERSGEGRGKEEVEISKVIVKKGIVIPGPSLVVNLGDINVPRFLKVSIVFEVDRGITVAEIQEKDPMIKDAIIGLLSSKTMSELQGYEAQQILKEELISRVNALLETGRIINIYFTEFVMQ